MISVCIATYNGELFIEEQLESILSQISESDEIVISDDGSSDDTVEKIKAFNDERIKWAGIGGHLGVVKNFERALYCAKGDYIFLSDQDDVWLPSKIEKSLEAMKHKVLVVTDCKVVDTNLNEIHPSFFNLRNSGPGVFHNLLRNSYLGCCIAFRKELLINALPFSAFTPMHDIWLGLLAEIYGGVAFLSSPLILYRRHNNNASYTAGKSHFSIWKMFKYRCILSALLIGRVTSNYLNYWIKGKR